MKTTELMIGDLVYCYGKPTKVAILTNSKVIGTEIGDGVITPIPLTPEILEKNGWNDEMHRFYNDDTFCELDLRIDNGHYTWVVCGASVCSFTYVHELQHALRLCGLNELADNFKVE